MQINWTRNVDSRFFHGDSRFSLTPDSYRVSHKEPHWHMLFNPEYTNQFLVLEAKRKNEFRDSALLGFNDLESHLDCKQVQGRQGAYRELTPIAWHKALLASLVDFARELEKDAVTIIPSFAAEGYSCLNAERLKIRYDANAIQLGFKLSETCSRYVLEL